MADFPGCCFFFSIFFLPEFCFFFFAFILSDFGPFLSPSFFKAFFSAPTASELFATSLTGRAAAGFKELSLVMVAAASGETMGSRSCATSSALEKGIPQNKKAAITSKDMIFSLKIFLKVAFR